MDECTFQNNDEDFVFIFFLKFHALRCESPFQNWDPHMQIKMKSLSGQDTSC